MILEAIVGVLASILGILAFKFIKYIDSISNWILSTSKFIYVSGHPTYDDDKKYELITANFSKVFKSLSLVILKTILLIIIIIFIVAATSYLIYFVREGELINLNDKDYLKHLFPNFLYRFPFIIGTLIPLFFISKLFNKEKNSDDAYSPIDKFLHYTFLGNNSLAKITFKAELLLNKKRINQDKNIKSVYISGLARAGTTVIMQYLGQIDRFNSLSYKNLPFVFMPRTWLKFSGRGKIKERERYHKDGLTHNLNSYEALEEPFWLHHLGNTYVKDNKLCYHKIPDEVYEKYYSYRELISKGKIYLCKNNNHLLRSASLHELDQKKGNVCITIIPVRSPYSQAKSLLNQHKNLSELQGVNEFALDYMNFLVHHEFGINNKISFLDETDESVLKLNKDSIEYWLEVWYIFYNKIFNLYNDKNGFYFLSYERFTNQPKESLSQVLGLIGLPESDLEKIKIKKFDKISLEYEEHPDKYVELYNKIILKTINNEN